jgi:hypothetical protein
VRRCAFFVAFFLIACRALPSEETEVQSEALIGGALGDPGAALYLASGCSATRVGERHILTAAHCVLSNGELDVPYRDGELFRYSNGWNIEPGHAFQWAKVATTIVDQGFRSWREGCNCDGVTSSSSGWALIVTTQPLGNIPIAPVDLDGVGEGETVLQTGYGCAERVDRGSDTQFRIAYNTTRHGETFYIGTTGPAGGGPAAGCPGDSGGPMWRGNAIVGVNSFHRGVRDGVPSSSWASRLSAVGDQLAGHGVTVCRSSEGSCHGSAPTWRTSRLHVLDKCIVPEDGHGEQNGTPIELRACNDEMRQRWIVLADGTFVHATSGRCLDLPGPEPGSRLHLWDCHGGWNQKFWHRDPSNMSVGELCVDVWYEGTADGTPIVGWHCHGGRGQQIGVWLH